MENRERRQSERAGRRIYIVMAVLWLLAAIAGFLFFVPFVEMDNPLNFIMASDYGKVNTNESKEGVRVLLEPDEGTLSVGVRTDLKGYAGYDRIRNEFFGVEIDMAKSLAEHMGFDKVCFVGVTLNDRTDALLEGKADCLVAAYSREGGALQGIHLSEDYLTQEERLVVRRSSRIESPEDLEGTLIGVRARSSSDGNVRSYFADAGIDVSIQEYGDYVALFNALWRGEVDAVCTNAAVAKNYFDSSQDEILPFSLGETHYVVATREGADLSEKADEAVRGMLSDGSMENILKNWGM